jgi:type IV pilus assembly protein PilV
MKAPSPRPLPKPPQAGFTLVEVLIALLISSIGLLGLAGMQALALASTQVASVRSLVALQASSLASAMHSNQRYWTVGTGTSSFSMKGINITDNKNELNVIRPCDIPTYSGSGQCTPTQLAASDVQAWANNMNDLLPAYTANATCSTNPLEPYSCQLNITWTERYVSMGRTAQTNSAATGGLRQYTLYIQP